jgi:hypothetical protein
MFYIAHRGNIDGPEPDNENSPQYITSALEKGYEVEIDVWVVNNKIYLGHDNPRYEIKAKFLTLPNLWCHAKNLDAISVLESLGTHYFWHQEDDITLTSQNYVWTYPGTALLPASICVMPERANYSSKELSVCGGICSDYIEKYSLEGKQNA